MKYTVKISAILIAAAAMMLSSCSKREMDIVDPATYDDNEVAFTIGSVSATKAESAVKSELLEIASVKVSEDHTMYLVDNVTSLDQVPSEPATKGTPAFTENVKALYGSFNAVALDADDGTAAFSGSDSPHEFSWKQDMIWRHNYKEAIWSDKLPIYFFMWMPTDITSNGVEFNDNSYDVNDGSINFSYISPGAVTEVAEGVTPESQSATKQQDILFASHKRESKVNGETITFYHALTGVKFANYFDYSLNEGAYAKAETIIKKVTITGLKNSGSCVVTPGSGKTSSTAVNWNVGETTATFTQSIDYDFADYSKSQYGLGNLLDETAAKQNLNDNDGSLTFWFVPQEIAEDVTITVVFDVTLRTVGSDGAFTTDETTFTDKTLTVNLYDALAEGHREWQPGELHTFTLWPTAIGVKITDTMSDDKTEKDNVVVKNTGNTWQYVRVNIVGNWVGKRVTDAAGHTSAETILIGYAAATGETETEPWNDKDGYTTYGTFTNLVQKGTVNGYESGSYTAVNNWVRFDKYWYYIKAIGPNDAITEPIFDSYVVGASPEFWIVDLWGIRRLAQDVHLEMDLMVEAIEAPTNYFGELTYPDGTLIGEGTDGFIKAWVDALGLDSDTDLDDLS